MPVGNDTALASLFTLATSKGVRLDRERILHAFALAQSTYGDTMHWSGESLMNHVLGTLEELLPFEPDQDTIIACLLHHVLESGTVTLSDLENEFGPDVRSIVSGEHLLGYVTLRDRRQSIQDLRMMLMRVSDDIRIVLLALCGRCHGLKVMDLMTEEERKQVCKDVLQLFAPVAARLGIYWLKHEMEGLAFPTLYPDDAKRVQDEMHAFEEERSISLEKTAEGLQAALEQKGVTAKVEWREKQPYSTFMKMKSRSFSSVEQVYDLFAFRVIVDSSEDCYRALGLLHQITRPLPHRFKDYIAFPKPNGYQSLHTTLVQLPEMPTDTCAEIQIRTKEMHREAQFGVAAHWSYKEHGSALRAAEQVQLKEMLISQESVGEESAGEAALVDHIFVLTPQGEIVELPEGATPLDFAFQVHTELGLSFRNARVNGVIVPMDYELENGDVVEVLKFSTPQPSPHWIQLLKMASSRSKLKRYFYAQKRPELVSQGKTLINAELKKRDLPALDRDLSILKHYNDQVLTLERREDLLMKVGQGNTKPGSVLMGVATLKKEIAQKKKKDTIVRSIFSKPKAVRVEGGMPVPTRFAKCCRPDQQRGCSIVGTVTRFGKVMVHRSDCHMLRNTNTNRRVNVSWDEAEQKKATAA